MPLEKHSMRNWRWNSKEHRLGLFLVLRASMPRITGTIEGTEIVLCDYVAWNVDPNAVRINLRSLFQIFHPLLKLIPMVMLRPQISPLFSFHICGRTETEYCDISWQQTHYLIINATEITIKLCLRVRTYSHLIWFYSF